MIQGFQSKLLEMPLHIEWYHVMDDGSERPVAFASCTLTASECNYTQVEIEALALVLAIKMGDGLLLLLTTSL